VTEEGQEKEKEEKKKNWKIFLLIFLLFLLALSLPPLSCGAVAFTQPVSGKVIDRETKKPIPDARIKVEWSGQPILYPETVHLKIKKETYKTDEEGNFKIPTLLRPSPFLVSFNQIEVLVYAHGYKATYFFREPTLFGAWGEGRFGKHGHEYEDILPKGLKRKGTIIELKPLKTAEEWAENIEMLEYIYLRPDENPEEKKFIEEDMEYGKRFKKAK
jgi:hypothetical protein